MLVITGIPFAVVLGDENALALQEHLGLQVYISQTPVLFAVCYHPGELVALPIFKIALCLLL